MKMIEIRDKDGVYAIAKEEFVCVNRGHYAVDFRVGFKTREATAFTYETIEAAADAYAQLVRDLKGGSK